MNTEEFNQNTKCDEDSEAFLAPVLQNKAATQVKKHGSKVKSHAQALGIVNPNEKNNDTATIKEKSKDNEVGQKKATQHVSQRKNAVEVK